MTRTQPFKLSSRGLLLAAVSAAFAQSAFANSGRVDFTAGRVTVTGADGGARPLLKGNEVKTGDRITSDESGRAQIRFSDGSYVSLQPNTDFAITNYAYDGKTDGLEKAVFNLFKGAMRTVTGLVGRRNRDAYSLQTPTATIGIRGTGGVISVGADGATLVQGTSGVWTLTNGGGSVDIPAGKAGAAGTDQSKPPQQTSQGPDVPAPAATQQEQPKFSEGEKRTSTGSTDLGTTTTTVTFKPLVTGTGYHVATTGGSNAAMAVATNADFNSAGQMTAFVDGGSTYTLTGTHAEFQTVDGVLAWGRWTSPVNVNGSAQPFPGGFHYVVGTPTPQASLPGGVTYTYNMIGATSPTAANGSATGTLNSAMLTGNFSTNNVSVNFAGSIGGKTFDATINNMSLNTGQASFSGSGGPSNFTTAGANTLNNSSCSTLTVKGFFSGAGATYAGFSYNIANTNLGGGPFGPAVSGAVALKR
jgi:hypothetical protein